MVSSWGSVAVEAPTKEIKDSTIASDSNATSSLFWVYRIWAYVTETQRKNRALKSNLREINKDLSKMMVANAGESAAEEGMDGLQQADGKLSEVALPDEDVTPDRTKISGDSTPGLSVMSDAINGITTLGKLTLPLPPKKTPEQEELEILRSRVEQLEAEKAAIEKEAEIGIGKALETLQNMSTMKNRVVTNMAKAKKNLYENLGSFAFHNSTTEPYLDQRHLKEPIIPGVRGGVIGNCVIHEELHDITRCGVPRVDFRKICKLEFCRDFVGKNRPCIFTNVLSEEERESLMGAFSSLNRLKQKIGPETLVRVNVTPDGVGDAVKRIPIVGDGSQPGQSLDLFVLPQEMQLPFEKFCDVLEGHRKGTSSMPKFVPYMSLQNDCLRQEDALKNGLEEDFRRLFKPIQEKLAHEVLTPGESSEFEAANLWVGDERSLSSFHKDPYENLYLVTKGQKVFWLAPPASHGCFYEEKYRTANYVLKNEDEVAAADMKIDVLEKPSIEPDWTIDFDPAGRSSAVSSESSTVRRYSGVESHESFLTGNGEVPWIPIDLRRSMDGITAQFPNFRQAHCKQIFLRPNEMLYLPSMWLHAATQSEATIAVNCWYDMNFDSKYAYFEFLKDSSEK